MLLEEVGRRRRAAPLQERGELDGLVSQRAAQHAAREFVNIRIAPTVEAVHRKITDGVPLPPPAEHARAFQLLSVAAECEVSLRLAQGDEPLSLHAAPAAAAFAERDGQC